MKQLAEDLYVLEGFPPYAINAYLLGNVLVDAATRFDAPRILRRLRGRTVGLHALTHAHPDHQGASHAVCEALGIPLWCGDADTVAMETAGEIMARMPRHWLSRLVGPVWAGPPHPVSRRLREGDQVGTFTVIETPGHTAGHISFWREADGVLVVGDVLCNLNIWTGRTMLREPERRVHAGSGREPPVGPAVERTQSPLDLLRSRAPAAQHSAVCRICGAARRSVTVRRRRSNIMLGLPQPDGGLESSPDGSSAGGENP